MDKKPNEIVEENDQPQQEEPKPNRTKWMLIMGLLAVQLVVAVALVYFVIVPRVWPDKVKKSEPKAEVKKEKKEKDELGVIFTISDLTVNPKDSYGRRFAVFEVALEVESESDKKELERYRPIIVDQFLDYLRSRTVAQLTIELDIQKMKYDMSERVNEIIGKNIVKNLYFTRFVLE